MTRDGRVQDWRDPGQEDRAIPPTKNRWCSATWLELSEAWLLALKVSEGANGPGAEFMQRVARKLHREMNRLYALKWRSA